MQACMRMRQLGKGHAVSFWAPPEVYRLLDASPSSTTIVKWCFDNTINQTRDVLASWAVQGFLWTDRAYAKQAFAQDEVAVMNRFVFDFLRDF